MKETDNFSEEDRWGGGEGGEYRLKRGWRREGGVDMVPPLAWQGAGRLLLGCAVSVIMHVAAGLSGSGSCAATELYLEIPVINEASASFCMVEVDEK